MSAAFPIRVRSRRLEIKIKSFEASQRGKPLWVKYPGCGISEGDFDEDTYRAGGIHGPHSLYI
jgi:hypothetical protein